MRHQPAWIGLLACTLLATSAAAQSTAELDEHLRFLEPLMGQRWEGGFVGDNAPAIVISLRFEPALAGRAVRYTREVAERDYTSETLFYWSPNREATLFLSLNSRGIVGEGVASMEDGAIVLRGVDYWPDGSYESRTVWQIDPQGALRDTFTRMENGQWVPGHVQEFTAKGGGEAGRPPTVEFRPPDGLR
jgi:hypothetical protein